MLSPLLAGLMGAAFDWAFIWPSPDHLIHLLQVCAAGVSIVVFVYATKYERR